jgi:hypothetical protein
MKLSRTVLAGLMALAATAFATGAFGSPTPTASEMPRPSPPAALYHCTWTRRFGGGVRWTGDLTMRIHPEGMVNGTYRSTSVQPDPFGQNVTVTGGRTGNNIRLTFGIRPSVTVRGEYEGVKIVGSATIRSSSFLFVAVPAN